VLPECGDPARPLPLSINLCEGATAGARNSLAGVRGFAAAAALMTVSSGSEEWPGDIRGRGSAPGGDLELPRGDLSSASWASLVPAWRAAVACMARLKAPADVGTCDEWMEDVGDALR
jgi:hypothetical protein